jgi:hypothetical protein
VANSSYTVKILWRAEHAPDWELDTAHPGFASAIDSALYANGFTTPAPEALELSSGHLVLRMTGGSCFRLGGEVTDAGSEPHQLGEPAAAAVSFQAWRLGVAASEDAEVVDADDYSEVAAATPADLSEAGLDGTWLPCGYDVIGPSGHVGVTIDLDETGNTLTVTVEPPDTRDLDPDAPVLAVIPKA